ncbi:ATP-binding protein [bacterium]|nr:ATP-binding protein [bacterium]
MNNPVRQEIINISHSSEAAEARRITKTMALSIGFDEKVSEEIVIVISELAANLIKYARNGTLTLTPLDENGPPGIKIESRDTGPGIVDVEQAIGDGYSTAGSLGYGLGTVNRLMDEFNITSDIGKNAGTYIVCTRRLKNENQSMKACPLDVGAATRMYPRMDVNGDAYVIKKWDENLLAGVIDGLGHGQFAHRASEKARQYVETHYDQSFEELFRGVERSCRATRGVVMALAKFDWGREKLTYASLGNIDVKFLGCAEPVNFVVRRGIIGLKSVKPVVTEHTWSVGSLMALYSDGIRSHWRWDDFPGLRAEPAATIAQNLLRSLARDNDDATIVIVKDRIS